MANISTLTLNPTIDVAYQVEKIIHTTKTRTIKEYYNPGGGGINVARVIVRLGGNARCYYLSGGATGPALDGLLELHQLVREHIAIEGNTRISTAILERESAKEFRFVPPGPVVTAAEWQECLDRLAEANCDYLVVSGSLPPGVPEDFYARAAALVVPRGIRVVLDSSGLGLSGGLAGGNIFLVKPSIGELREYTGEAIEGIQAVAAAAMAIVNGGRAQYVAVTMGEEGALLAREAGPLFLPALDIEAKSAVGAGDSFLAAMVFALCNGRDEVDAFRFGIAAGAAAVLSPGTNLSYPDDIARLYPLVQAADLVPM